MAEVIYGWVLSAILPGGRRALHAGLRGTNAAGGGGWVGRGPTLIDLLQPGAKVNNETFPGGLKLNVGASYEVQGWAKVRFPGSVNMR